MREGLGREPFEPSKVRTMRWTNLVMPALAAAWLGCTAQEDDHAATPTDSLVAETTESSTDADAIDAKADVAEGEDVVAERACDLIYYWDCPGYPPFQCGAGGVVWARFKGSEPAHCPGDPWPYGGPTCTEETPAGKCPSGICLGGAFDAAPYDAALSWTEYCVPADGG